MSVFTLLIDGERYHGWKTIRVTRGLKRAATDFALSVSNREDWPIFPGAACEVYIDDDRVLIGWVDAFRPSCSATDHAIEVTGRSKTGDFIDSSVTLDGGQFNGMTVRQVAELLAQPFNIEVVAEVEGDVVPEVQLQQGETCFKLVERLARLQELLVTDDPDGRLVLTRAGSARASTALRFGFNVKSASADVDNSQRFSHYIVKAQRPGNRTHDDKMREDRWANVQVPPAPTGRMGDADGWRAAWRRWLRAVRQNARLRAQRLADDFDEEDGDENGNGYEAWDGEPGSGTDRDADRGVSVITQIASEARDYGITRYRPKVIIAETQADDDNAEKRADWEMRRRIAEGLSAKVTVNGWRQNDGKLWNVNQMVDVAIPWLGLDREMLIGEVEYSMSEQGEMTQLSLTLPDAFLPEKQRRHHRSKRAAGGKKKEKADMWANVQRPPGESA